MTPTGNGNYSVSNGPFQKVFGSGTEMAVLQYNITSITVAADSLTLNGPVTELVANHLLDFDFSPLVGGTNTFILSAPNFMGANDFPSLISTPGALAIGSGLFNEGFGGNVIPEPTSMALLGIGLSGLFTFRRLFKRAFVA